MTIILPPRYQIPHLEDYLRHLFRFLASCIIWYTKGLMFLLQKFWHLVPLSASWFHNPPVLTCFSCHDLRMKANHEPLAQEWTFPNSCDILSQTQPSIWKTHHARNITWRHILLLLQSNKFHIMWTSPCALTSWCQNSSTKNKSKKHASSNNWLSSQA